MIRWLRRRRARALAARAALLEVNAEALYGAAAAAMRLDRPERAHYLGALASARREEAERLAERARWWSP